MIQIYYVKTIYKIANETKMTIVFRCLIQKSPLRAGF